MKNISKLFALVAVIVAGLNVSTVEAKEPKTRQYDYQMMTTKSIAEQRTNMLSSLVTLSEEQKEKVFQVELKLAEQQIALKDKFKGSTDREAVKKAHGEVLTAHEESIKSILTEEQYTALKSSTAVQNN